MENKMKKSDAILTKICADTYDKSQMIKSTSTYFIAAISSTKHTLHNLIKYTYKTKKHEVLSASNQGTFADFVKQHSEG